jgi:hypothetical protein
LLNSSFTCDFAPLFVLRPTNRKWQKVVDEITNNGGKYAFLFVGISIPFLSAVTGITGKGLGTRLDEAVGDSYKF